MRVETITYTGNGVDDRDIATSFDPELVIIKSEAGTSCLWRGTQQAGDDTDYFRGLNGGNNRIQSLGVLEFQIGDGGEVNTNAVEYQAIVFADDGDNARLMQGNYTGNGADDRDIGGLADDPDYGWVKSDADEEAVQTHNLDGDNCHVFWAGAADFADGIQSLGVTEFQVGTDGRVNANGVDYNYVMMTEFADNVEVGSHTGNGADNRSIGGFGFEPIYMKLKSDGAATHQGVHRPDTLAGDNTLFYQSQAIVANYIQALEAAGYQVGSASIVNQNAVVYHVILWKDLVSGVVAARRRVGYGAGSSIHM